MDLCLSCRSVLCTTLSVVRSRTSVIVKGVSMDSELQDRVTSDTFDFKVESVDLPPVEIVETIDESVLAGMLTSRCN